MYPRQILASTEFDSCWDVKKPLHENIIALFSNYTPYPWNLFSRKHHSGTAAGIIKHINEGYPTGNNDEKVNLKDNPDLLFLYLCMTDQLLKKPNPNGELKRRLNYAYYKIGKPIIHDAPTKFFAAIGLKVAECLDSEELSEDEDDAKEADNLVKQSVYYGKKP